MTDNDLIAMDAAMTILAASEQVAVGVAMHIQETPNLDPETKAILEASAHVISLLSKVVAKSVEESVSHTEFVHDINDRLKEITGD
jgi:hypothetical protein